MHLRTIRKNTPGRLPNIETEAAPERRSKWLNMDVIVVEQKAVTLNSYRIPFDMPACILQQDEEVGYTDRKHRPDRKMFAITTNTGGEQRE